MHNDVSDSLVFYGGSVKALGDGKVGGHLVLFSTEADPDLTNEFFTALTDFRIAKSSPMFMYNHGMDKEIGLKELGSGASVKVDGNIGIWVESQLDLRDAYEKAIYKMCEDGKLGWSSGTASHLVRKKKTGKATEILAWPLVEASLTPTPAEPRTHAVPLKSLIEDTFDGSDTGLSFGELSTRLVTDVGLFCGVVTRFSDQRIKAGRVLSGANRDRIRRLLDTMQPVLNDLEALYVSTGPQSSESDNEGKAARLKALKLAQLARQLHARVIENGKV